jgi:four helix bundle protein
MLAYSKQLIRSSSSVGANYRAACRAKSLADFINKLKIVEEEADESIYFLELIDQLDSSYKKELDPLIKEGNELLSIIVASINTSKRRNFAGTKIVNLKSKI